MPANMPINKQGFNANLLEFLDQAPTPFHAVAQLKLALKAKGFQALKLEDPWSLVSGQGYYITRNDSALIAFVYQGDTLHQAGISFVGAHTDSPCLKLKPNPLIYSQGCVQLGVEVYGGALLNPWFDRELSLAGRITYVDAAGKITSCLWDAQAPIACIPSLAIHLDREANKGREVNAQLHLPAVCMQADDASMDFKDFLRQALAREDIQQILDYELSLYDTQKASYWGWNQEFIASARLDNLVSCYVGLQTLLTAAPESQKTLMLVCMDHEEVGSASCAGAHGPFLAHVLRKLAPEEKDYQQMLAASLFISCDNAHAQHPNFADRHDLLHAPQLNQGPVIKFNANQRYATNSETSAIFRWACQQAQVPVQAFSMRSDLACGSTLGPISASEIGVKTLDVGVPQWGMHSIRETMGADDAYSLYQALVSLHQLKV